MIFSMIMFVLALIFAVLFWVWVVRAILTKIKKMKFGKNNIIALILFGLFGWVFFFIGIAILSVQFASGGYKKVAENSAYVAAVTADNARKGWNKGLLKKLDSLTFELDTVQEVEEEFKMTNSNFRTFEATLIINNATLDKSITYKELRNAGIVYAEDENGVFIPAFVVNHSTFDEVPWILRFFLPNYRREAQNQYLPLGRSYLNVRIDIAEGHTIQKIGVGEQLITVGSDKISYIDKIENE